MNNIVFLKGRNSPFGMRNKNKKKPELSRNEQIVLMREEGKTFQAIAGKFGISTARVQQIVKKESSL